MLATCYFSRGGYTLFHTTNKYPKWWWVHGGRAAVVRIRPPLSASLAFSPSLSFFFLSLSLSLSPSSRLPPTGAGREESGCQKSAPPLTPEASPFPPCLLTGRAGCRMGGQHLSEKCPTPDTRDRTFSPLFTLGTRWLQDGRGAVVRTAPHPLRQRPHLLHHVSFLYWYTW